MAKRMGSLSHPNVRSIARKMISMGTVTRTRVSMTRRDDGLVSLGWVRCDVAA